MAIDTMNPGHTH